MSATSLRQQLETEGWRGTTEATWQRIHGFQGGVAILAPPLDTIPSPFGNAVYDLVESLAARLPCVPLVLGRWPADGRPGRCQVSDRILYDTAPMRPGRLEQLLPHRLKKAAWNTSAPHLLGYARRAARAARLVGIRTFVIEDIPVFAPVARKDLPAGTRILLHQHNNAPAAASSAAWSRVARSLDGIVFVAARPREEAEARHGPLPMPSWIVYNGVDGGHFNPKRWAAEGARRRQVLGVGDGGIVLAFLGRVVPGKGVAELAEAFTGLSRPDARLVIAGDLDRSLYADRHYSNRIRDAARQSSGRITLAGAVAQSDVPGWLAAADVVVAPSTAPEGLPKTITEALAMGKPCLASDRGGVRELVRDGVNGWIIAAPVTPTSIRDGLARACHEFRSLSPATSPTDISLGGMVRRFERILAGESPEPAHP